MSRIRGWRVLAVTLSAAVTFGTGFAWSSAGSLQADLARAVGLDLGIEEDGSTDILLVGIDSRSDAHGNPLAPYELAMLRAGDEPASNTDTMILVRVPKNGQSATAVSIPRDTWVNAPGIGETKINAVYGATRLALLKQLVEVKHVPMSEAEPRANEAGRKALLGAVANLTGVSVDHYGEIGLLGFVLLTNAIGGVDVCLNQAVYEPLSGAQFRAGKQTLDGPDALSFVRQRHDLPRGDLDRIVRQQTFMAALAHKMLSTKTLASPSKLDELNRAVSRSVVLDEGWDVLDFAQQLQGISGGKVKFTTIPIADPDGVTPDGESIVAVEPEAVHEYLASLVAPEPTENGFDTTTLTVDVANDSQISGLATRVSGALMNRGYREGKVGNFTGKKVSESQVVANDTDNEGAAAVAEELGGLTIVADKRLPGDRVRVVLASDYTGPGTRTEEDPSGMNSVGVGPAGAIGGVASPPIDAGDDKPGCVN